MRLTTRKLLDGAFSVMGFFSVALMAVALALILGPICARGVGAFVFKETVEHRRFALEKLGRGNADKVKAEVELAEQARQPVYDMVQRYEAEIGFDFKRRRQLEELKSKLRRLLGPFPSDPQPVLLRERYGPTRWERAQARLQDFLYEVQYDYSDPTKPGKRMLLPRVDRYRGSTLEPLFSYVEEHLEEMLRPRWTIYWRFLTDEDYDAHMFGGIWPAVLGTLYLTLGAMLIAAPMGMIAAIYLAEYAGHGRFISLLRTCISTLAGVPSIVFGLFGLAFFINTVHVSDSKSVLAGSLTLALLILPTVIRASEEAIRAVPHAYREAAVSLGASRWRTVLTVILPAALPGVLTSIIISMGRAAGETAPIIFTAAVSLGRSLKPWETLSQPTPALPWNIYNLATEHEAVDEIRHVQFGMVLTLVVLVLILNLAAIILRARVMRKLRG
jgi:phosphate transport system permease protein